MKNLIFTILIFLIGMLQVQSQNGFKNSEEHKAFKQNLMDEVKGNFTNSINPNTSFKQKSLKSGITDYGNAPAWNWASQFGGSAADYGRDVITDATGNIYMAGSFSREITLEGNALSSTGSRDAIVLKFDDTGNLVWIKQLSASVNEEIDAYGICLDDYNNIYLTGYYTGSVTLGTYTLPNIAIQNLFFAKLNSSGEVVMAKNHGNAGDTEIGHKIDTDDNGNIYILGSTDGAVSYSNPSIILKYDSNGNFLMDYVSEENFIDFAVFGSSIYFTGAILGEGYIGDFYLDPISYNDAFIAKSDLEINFEWATMAGHNSNYGRSYASGLFINQNEEVFLTGYFDGDLIFGDFDIAGENGFITKCTTDGYFLWLNKLTDESYSYYARDYSKVCSDNNYAYVNYKEAIIKFDVSNGDRIGTEVLCYEAESLDFDYTNNKINITGNIDELMYVSQLNNLLNEEWIIQSEGDSGFGYIIGMETDQSGNFYTYGYASSTMDYFGEVIQKGTFLSKQKPDGEIIWIKQFLGLQIDLVLGNYIMIDPANENIYITGGFTETFTIPGGPIVNPNSGHCVFIIKFGTDGTYKLVIQEDLEESDLLCLASDYSGNILLSGTFSNEVLISGEQLVSSGMDDAYIAKYNSSMNLDWVIQAGGTDQEYVGLISIDENDNIYFTGEFYSVNVSIANSTITMNQGDGNIIFAKLSPSGTVEWVTSKAGRVSIWPWADDFCWRTGIKTDAQGYTYIKGWHGDSTYFDNIMLRSPYNNFSYFIAKFDPNGNTIWANSITEHQNGLDYNQMDIDFQGNVYTGAQARDTIHFGNDFTYINAGENDLFVAKYLTNGELDWVKTMESTTGYNWLSSVAVFDTNIFISGDFYNYITFDDDAKYSNNQHGFVAMSSKNYLGFREVYNRSDMFLNIYPNPFYSRATIKFTNSNHSTYKLSIFSISGNKVFEMDKIKSDKIEFEKGNLPKGVYLIELKGGKIYRGKMVVK